MASGMDRWKNKVAVVTGAASGNGASIAERLVRDGLKVIGMDLNMKGLEELAKKLQKTNSPGKFHPIQGDVTKENDIVNAFKWTVDNVGPIHILVNNAGVAMPCNLLEGLTESWRTVIEVNLLAVAVCSREAIKIMRAHGIDDGHIVNINSVTGHTVPLQLPMVNVYAASKFGVTGLTKTLRSELRMGSSNIKVTSVSPGFVKTNVLDKFPQEIQKGCEKFPSLFPEDIANTVAFVISTPPHVSIAEITVVPVGEEST